MEPERAGGVRSLVGEAGKLIVRMPPEMNPFAGFVLPFRPRHLSDACFAGGQAGRDVHAVAQKLRAVYNGGYSAYSRRWRRAGDPGGFRPNSYATHPIHSPDEARCETSLRPEIEIFGRTLLNQAA